MVTFGLITEGLTDQIVTVSGLRGRCWRLWRLTQSRGNLQWESGDLQLVALQGIIRPYSSFKAD